MTNLLFGIRQNNAKCTKKNQNAIAKIFKMCYNAYWSEALIFKGGF